MAEAKAFLRQGEGMPSGNATFNYTTACFECQLGNIPAAKARLEVACRLDPKLREMAVKEEDLTPIWQAMYSRAGSGAIGAVSVFTTRQVTQVLSLARAEYVRLDSKAEWHRWPPGCVNICRVSK